LDRCSIPSSNGTVVVTANERQFGLGRLLWDAWKAYASRAGRYQAQVLLSVIYYTLLGPSVLIAALLGTRQLDLDTRPRSSYWIQRTPAAKTLAAMERQF